MPAPKVFLSHASEDKNRFVNDFASRLRRNGVDVWLDKWEMLPGDSLVDKIFEEGLKNAQAVIIVVSSHSVTKSWVTQELNTSVISRVQKGTRLIPVVIDECEVPEALKSTVWEKIPDLSNYEGALRRILAAIHGESLKPEIGPPPAYTSIKLNEISGLEPLDNLVLRVSGDSMSEWPYDPVEPEQLFSRNLGDYPPKEKILESLEILDDKGYLNVSHYFGGGSERWGCHYTITTFGFEEYCRAYIGDYGEMKMKIASQLVNSDLRSNDKIARETGISKCIVSHVITQFADDGYVTLGSVMTGALFHVLDVSSSLRRALR